MSAPTKDLITITECVELLPCKVSRQSILRWIQVGISGRRLPAIRVGYRFKVDRGELFRFLAELQPNAAEAAPLAEEATA
jgi:hypothetical protein